MWDLLRYLVAALTGSIGICHHVWREVLPVCAQCILTVQMTDGGKAPTPGLCSQFLGIFPEGPQGLSARGWGTEI